MKLSRNILLWVNIIIWFSNDSNSSENLFIILWSKLLTGSSKIIVLRFFERVISEINKARAVAFCSPSLKMSSIFLLLFKINSVCCFPLLLEPCNLIDRLFKPSDFKLCSKDFSKSPVSRSACAFLLKLLNFEVFISDINFLSWNNLFVISANLLSLVNWEFSDSFSSRIINWWLYFFKDSILRDCSEFNSICNWLVSSISLDRLFNNSSCILGASIGSCSLNLLKSDSLFLIICSFKVISSDFWSRESWISSLCISTTEIACSSIIFSFILAVFSSNWVWVVSFINFEYAFVISNDFLS